MPWAGVTSVHAQQQTLLEGLATAFPMFVAPHDAKLVLRARLAHYTHLVLAELHLAVNDGTPVATCIQLARKRLPFWSDARIGDALNDRSVNPLLRSYMWAYSAGTDWLMRLSQASQETISRVFERLYLRPLGPHAISKICGWRVRLFAAHYCPEVSVRGPR